MRLPAEIVEMIVDHACPYVPATREEFVPFAAKHGLHADDFTFVVKVALLDHQLPADRAALEEKASAYVPYVHTSSSRKREREDDEDQ